MNNNIWANAYWNFFHIFSCNLNEKKINTYNLELIHLFMNNLIMMIPCEKCKIDAVQYFENNNFKNINSKKQFIIFFYLFHNYLNFKTNKKNYKLNILNKYKNLDVCKELKIIDETIYNSTLNKNVFLFFNKITN